MQVVAAVAPVALLLRLVLSNLDDARIDELNV